MSIALPVRVLPFGIGTFTPPLPPFYPMHCRCVDLGVCLPQSIRLSKGYSLPIRSNRISWKLLAYGERSHCRHRGPYLLGQIGLVGNLSYPNEKLKSAILPYLLGQIGLVGNVVEHIIVPNNEQFPYLLGQIGLVGNQFLPQKEKRWGRTLTY